ncbi:MAG TPA: hypothetical protein VJL34_02375 [Anaerolineales bacterium]|nr:hypothetical protein [Anaerolineales bacterium]
MSYHLELIHTADNDPSYNMPYTPAIKVHSGVSVYVAGVTAAPVYHHHPHRPTSTTVEVARLATDARLVLELTAIAVLPT